MLHESAQLFAGLIPGFLAGIAVGATAMLLMVRAALAERAAQAQKRAAEARAANVVAFAARGEQKKFTA